MENGHQCHYLRKGKGSKRSWGKKQQQTNRGLVDTTKAAVEEELKTSLSFYCEWPSKQKLPSPIRINHFENLLSNSYIS